MSKLAQALRELWPLIERSMKGYVFTANKAGEIAAHMQVLRDAALAEHDATPHAAPARRMVNGVYTAPPAQPVAPTNPHAAPVAWWLIECKNGFTGWWDGRDRVDCRFFDRDPNRAFRFPTKEAAEQLIAARGNSCMVATEHTWIAATHAMPVVYQATEQDGEPRWGDGAFSDCPTVFEHYRALYACRS